MTLDELVKVRARQLARRAADAGRIKLSPCEQCGSRPAQKHHDDYSKPVEVRWLCAKCHCRLHQQKHPLEKACENCGEIYSPHPTKRARSKSCSESCRRALQAAKRQKYPAEKSCAVCGCTFRPPVVGRLRRKTCGSAVCVAGSKALARAVREALKADQPLAVAGGAS